MRTRGPRLYRTVRVRRVTYREVVAIVAADPALWSSVDDFVEHAVREQLQVARKALADGGAQA